MTVLRCQFIFQILMGCFYYNQTVILYFSRHIWPIFLFFTPWKHQEIFGFLGFFFFEGGDKMGIFPGNGLMERKLGNRTIADILIINLPPCKTRKTKTKSFVNPLMHNVPK